MNILQQKNLVDESPGLRKLVSDGDLWTFKKPPAPNFVALEQAPQYPYEQKILATWTARKLLRLLFTHVYSKTPGDKLSKNELVPILAVLQSPNEWIIRQKSKRDADDSPYVSITIQGNIVVENRFDDKAGPATKQPKSLPELVEIYESPSWPMALPIAKRSYTRHLNGKVIVPFSESGNSTSDHYIRLETPARNDTIIPRSDGDRGSRGESSRQNTRTLRVD